MKIIFELTVLGVFSFLISHILTPYLRNLATKLHLIDHPNYRKVHITPIPLVGGIAIGITFFLVGSLVQGLFRREIFVILSGAYIMLLMGIVDDKTDLKAQCKLCIQLCLGFFVALYGVRITSFYGIFGIDEIPVFWQYFITMILIAGSVNAFNFMDGIDGLAASIALLGVIFLSVLSYFYKDIFLAKFSIILVGCLVSFIRYNFSKTKKIFLGDAGSLFLGFLLITLGIHFVEHGGADRERSGILYLLLVFLLPIFDFVRVFSGRIINRLSPFKADKTHLHHYLIQIGFSHKNISLIVVFANIVVLVFGFIAIKWGQLEGLISCVIILFLLYKLAALVRNFKLWKNKINGIENSSGQLPNQR